MKVAVYFISGHKAVLEAENVVFVSNENASAGMEIDLGGKTIVNWRNVCFIREAEVKSIDAE